ncbi:c-type cytochrome [Stenotrophomonas mori]|uniref:Cytochrome c4 n=1 Tax=Stenotrophomonas mori TaxID=2871096 RepID=A0ABT0SEF1_9GAMM|nr:c-type cytochrome [Stenotrophomonas mori]MCL7713699.1 cytochrome c4 [Stenotrophomonas mori]
MKTMLLLAPLLLAGTPAADAGPAADPPGEVATATPPVRYDLRRAQAVPGDAQAGKAKAEVCGACHGENGIAPAPLFPNLAGQPAAYLYWSLQAYRSGRLPESPMTALAATLQEQDIRDLASYYASLPVPPPAPETETATAGTDAALAGRGRALYLDGDPSRGIPPCQGCHGDDARGNPLAGYRDRSGRLPYAAYPALRGQQPDYLRTRLQQFHGQAIDASSNSRIMEGVGQRLDADSIEALSTWLSSLNE